MQSQFLPRAGFGDFSSHGDGRHSSLDCLLPVWEEISKLLTTASSRQGYVCDREGIPWASDTRVSARGYGVHIHGRGGPFLGEADWRRLR